ncbi:MAG: 2-polyprenylphenol 6-hydroxylase [Gammaproteobacteria bacterium]|jgi:ubiquinone biosynthesis protein|nr:2-polyprenylphenol 6-hydroxylase [Gammaproteobacteria bacterium]
MITAFQNALRFIHLTGILLRYSIDDLLTNIPLFSPLKIAVYCNPYYYRNRKKTRGERLYQALIQMGPVFVKFGQALSTRRDLLPDDIADSLVALQDKVPPFEGTVAKTLIEKAYHTPLESVFSDFDLKALGSASIAQVHRARLHDGTAVVVKVLRPRIKKVIRRDIAFLYSLAKWIDKFWKAGNHLQLKGVVAEFEKTILQELDLQREAANASQLRRHFEGSPYLYVPRIYWPYTRRNVMVMEYIEGISVSDLSTLKARGVNLKKLAENSVTIFFTQVIEHRFFHADLHPGNIFVCADDPHNPYFIVVDFGIMGSLTPNDQRYLAEIFLAFFKRDYYRVAILHVECGWVDKNVRIDDFESAIRVVCEPIFEKPLKEISFANLLWGLLQTARQFNMPVQPQLVLLQKTLVNVEGLGRQLYPDLDLWATAKPYLERWVRAQYSPRMVLRKLRAQLPRYIEQLPQMPALIKRYLERV